MPRRSSVVSVSPILAVRDVEVSVAFYVHYLGFEEVFVMEDSSYGVVAFDGHSIHFTRAESPDEERLTRTRLAVYISVEGIDAYWERVFATELPTRFRALGPMPWGVREFHVMDPDGCLLRFGEEPE
ncbi:VOC family protein [Phaeovibrio sulfidiphilus]|uniref:Bleomycin resistance protein n=1 Tax=Phaeovibrio sulfidiphilus TaxID=1220600 RepID=A0A8J7CNZ2_9PROT|nr:VOC family protein [Phaeovibrio sulfidiphilus]